MQTHPSVALILIGLGITIAGILWQVRVSYHRATYVMPASDDFYGSEEQWAKESVSRPRDLYAGEPKFSTGQAGQEAEHLPDTILARDAADELLRFVPEGEVLKFGQTYRHDADGLYEVHK